MPNNYVFEIKLTLCTNKELTSSKEACKQLEMLLLHELSGDKVKVKADVNLIDNYIQKMPEKKIV